MTEREEIDMLRRELADLRERVRTLEARPVTPATVYGPPLQLPPIPQPPVQPTWVPPFVTTCELSDARTLTIARPPQPTGAATIDFAGRIHN